MMVLSYRPLSIIMFFLMIALSCKNQVSAEPIKFEQGGASNSPGIVDPGRLQMEWMYLSYSHLHGTNDNTFDLGETLLRYGLIKNRLILKVFL